MKKIIHALVLLVCLAAFPFQQSDAQTQVASIVSSIFKKVVVAIDLQVQQLQNETITLQNAEKQLENSMSLGGLNDISSWLGREKDLYSSYYKELQSVRQIIADYDLVKKIISNQTELVTEYKNAFKQFQQDKNFRASEITTMEQVYNGLLNESINDLDEVLMAINSFKMQMSDSERMQLIHTAEKNMQKHLDDLRLFNTANQKLSQQRVSAQSQSATVKQLYGTQ